VTGIRQMHERLQDASGLPAVLGAAHDAFDGMLLAIRAYENPADSLFIPLVTAAASAAEGRNAIIFAPSLPPRRLHPAAREREPDDIGAGAVIAELVALSELLAAHLTEAAHSAPDNADQAACRGAARSARDIYALLTGGGP
jgi:hypothetical protein